MEGDGKVGGGWFIGTSADLLFYVPVKAMQFNFSFTNLNELFRRIVLCFLAVCMASNH